MFSQSLPVTRWKSRLLASRPSIRKSAWRPCWKTSCFRDVTGVFRIGLLDYCCIPGPSGFSSRQSVPSDRVPYAVEEGHERSSVCRRRPTSSGSHAIGCRCRPRDWCRSHYWSSSAPILSTAASSLGTSWCSHSDVISAAFAYNRRIRRKDACSNTATDTKLNTAYGTFKLVIKIKKTICLIINF
jgi:hypothetical protein